MPYNKHDTNWIFFKNLTIYSLPTIFVILPKTGLCAVLNFDLFHPCPWVCFRLCKYRREKNPFTALLSTDLYCTALHCTALDCTAVHWTEYNVLQ